MRTAEHLQEVRNWPRLAGVLLVAMSLGLLGALLASGTAQAHDHQIPKTVLMQGKQELQTGRNVEWSDWYSSAGGVCAHSHADYEFGFPRVDGVAAGSKLKVRIHKAQKPRPFAMAEVDKEGVTRGEVVVRLEPVVRSGKRVAWDAVFRVDRPDTRYRLLSEGYWDDREGCGKQHAFWSFQVKTGGAS
jgi:hypothetical protein